MISNNNKVDVSKNIAKNSIIKDEMNSKYKNNLSINKNSVSNLNSTSGNIKEIFTNKNSIKNVSSCNNNQLTEIKLNNENLYDIDEGDEIPNKINKKKDDLMDIEESSTYKNGRKNNEIGSLNIKRNQISNIDMKVEKRKNNKNFSKEEKNPNNKKMKPEYSESITSEQIEKDIPKNENFEKNDILKNNNEFKNSEVQAPKQIKKIRKIKKTITYIDDEGFDCTKEISENEEYLTDEKSQSSLIGAKIKNGLNLNKAPALSKNPTVTTKKNSVKQKSLEMFFKK